MDDHVPKRLTIIVGAGASHDCIPHGSQPADLRFQPPLARDVFAPRFQDILEHYPRVEAHSDEIRLKLEHGWNIEKILLEFLKCADRNKNNWPLDIPRYVRELFWTISEDYLRGSSKFDTLVRRVLDYSFERVLFVSLNYDLFLESALERYDRHEFATVDSYVSAQKKWILIKPHGSVNWARILENCPKYADGLFCAPSALKEAPVFVPGLKLVRWNRHSHGFYVPRSNEEGYLYPEIVLPVDRPKEFVCPQSHAKRAREFVESCNHYLMIGFSAHDDDILGLLNVMPPRSRLTIVSRGDAQKIFQRMCSTLPSLTDKEVVTSFCDEGFGAYVASRQFEQLAE